MTNSNSWIIGGVRTPFVKAGGAFKRMPSYDLGRVAITELLAREELDPARLDQVILGNCAMPAEAANSTRVAGLLAGIPEDVPGSTVHRNCASGMESVAQSAYRIGAGEAKLILAGGMESMSQIPLFFNNAYVDWMTGMMRARTPGAKLGAALKFRPHMLAPRIGLVEGLTDYTCGLNMGQTAEVLSHEFLITREQQDAFALQSHLRAVAAREKLRDEITPVFPVPDYGVIRDDIGPREQQTMEALAKLKPYFDRKNGTVTAGNSSMVTDGAVSVLIADELTARSWPHPPLGRIRSFAFAGLSPKRMGLGPVFAIDKALERANLRAEQIELWEINEAFAAQVLACLQAAESNDFARKELGRDKALGRIPQEILNVNGGAIALGHPVGASGARLLITLLHEMRRRGQKLGVAALCVGGGQGAAFVLERE